MVRTTLVAVAAGIWLGKAGVDGVAQIWFDGSYLGHPELHYLSAGRTWRFSVNTIVILVLGKRNRRKWVREFGFRANDVAYLHWMLLESTVIDRIFVLFMALSHSLHRVQLRAGFSA